MNNLDDKTNENNVKAKEELGFRFRLFRKALRKSMRELASELDSSVPVIKGIEKGTLSPKITDLHYLYNKYGLNINWLLSKTGHMFAEKPEDNQGGKGGEIYHKYAELLDLMQVPAVEQAINAALTQIRALLELETDDFPDAG